MKKSPLEDVGFTKREQTGILVLLALIGICLGTPLLWEAYMPAPIHTDSAFLAEVAAFQKQLAAADTISRRRLSYTRNRYKKEWPAHAKGYQRPFYRDTTPGKQAHVFPRFPVRKPLLIDINQADSAAWEALPGIGPTLAARLVKFREKLGGFCSITQIAETYGLPDSTFKKIQPSLRLDNVSLKKLNINQMDEKSLAVHPYIRYKLARLIVQYRSVHGPFSHAEELRNIPLVDDSIYRKLEQYISF